MEQQEEKELQSESPTSESSSSGQHGKLTDDAEEKTVEDDDVIESEKNEEGLQTAGLADALTPIDPFETYRDELFELRLLTNAGRKANSWSATKQAAVFQQSTPSFGDKLRKKNQYHSVLEGLGQDPKRMELLRTALPTAEFKQREKEKKEKKSEAPANILGSEAAYRAYKRRLEHDMPAFDRAAYQRQKEGVPHVITEEIAFRVANDIKTLDVYRAKNASRRERQASRVDDELFGSTPSNRTLNRMAKKSYASVLAPISSDINRGTAL